MYEVKVFKDGNLLDVITAHEKVFSSGSHGHFGSGKFSEVPGDPKADRIQASLSFVVIGSKPGATGKGKKK